MPRLRKGQRFTLKGEKYRVLYVNDCRAAVQLVDSAPVTVNGKTFRPASRIVSVSANSEVA
jgi:ribosomal protein S4